VTCELSSKILDVRSAVDLVSSKVIHLANDIRGAIQKFPKFEFCARMVMSTSKYRYVSPHTPFLNQCGKRGTVEWLGLLLVNVFPLLCFRESAVLRWLT
jgi:hypothetical protein